MDSFNIYKDIAERTQGDIYVGVVGPVRTGKSTFIKKFMDLMVIPKIDNTYKKERAKDELPQSGSGKSIHTTEPKFVPNEAVEISLGDETKFKVRMVDCVGYIVKSALGYLEGEESKMVHTPWYEYEIPFEDAAEIGTRKVISDHSTIGLVITTDGSITGIPREDYMEAEERVIYELQSINKPFVVVLNTNKPNSQETKALKNELESKYNVAVKVMDIYNMGEEDIEDLFEYVLREFPVKEVNIDMPEWLEKLDCNHWLKKNFFDVILTMSNEISKVRDVKHILNSFEEKEFMGTTSIKEVDLGNGTANILMKPKDGVFYKILSEICDLEVNSESDLLSIIKELTHAKLEYDKVKDALEDVRESGYGLVAPQLSEMKFEEPEIVKQGSKFGVKLKASAPSLHFIKCDIKTEISPIMGSEKESEELVKGLLEQFETDPAQLWQSNMFGKSLEVLVKEGLQNKLYKMPEDVQVKIQKTLQKIINEGNGGLICIIL
ncbi:stage IV sporulation protein A [Clostridium botulinum]|uniref:Stage IV sporulation protein A n=1 Tax=Clostridium botulinum TaxID=1491 RepID=A0A6B4S9A8_CLOBO|nr:stage IV sporulation protein A [Clostridium botulinum]ACD52512.1 stage IV sporulation protein A [Clostridium botulinum E3 str. Alaska E43]AJF29167.1 stage IV sporulation protein A [Clostridium botulinum]AJF32228.1 stage IV sporulation protein A [Clostridium botulinum]EES50739.1 stage IV sporulation protein A [Clostridium botulinum E1 str. 'BoNT E Beluga']MBN1034950.1 stage IV sporulation protein A [Clostridium botulinum]